MQGKQARQSAGREGPAHTKEAPGPAKEPAFSGLPARQQPSMSKASPLSGPRLPAGQPPRSAPPSWG